jgi:hypothetical protein
MDTGPADADCCDAGCCSAPPHPSAIQLNGRGEVLRGSLAIGQNRLSDKVSGGICSAVRMTVVRQGWLGDSALETIVSRAYLATEKRKQSLGVA